SADDGSNGTLRSVLAAAAPGSTIVFDHSLNNATITLTGGQLNLNKNLDVEGPGANHLTVSGNSASRVFDVSNGAAVTLAGLTIANGATAGGLGGGGVLNES